MSVDDPAVPGPVLGAVGIDPTTDAYAVLDAAALPRTIPLYEPTFIGVIADAASAQAVASVLQRSIPGGAPAALIDESGQAHTEVAAVGDLAHASIGGRAWVVVPASDPRVEAVGALYAADLLGADAIDPENLSRRAAALAMGTWSHRADIDETLTVTARGWRLDRMTAVDRAILRLGTYELRHTDLATGIVVDRAVELAKRFSTDRSGAFVNGVLDAIARGRNTLEPSASGPEAGP